MQLSIASLLLILSHTHKYTHARADFDGLSVVDTLSHTQTHTRTCSFPGLSVVDTLSHTQKRTRTCSFRWPTPVPTPTGRSFSSRLFPPLGSMASTLSSARSFVCVYGCVCVGMCVCESVCVYIHIYSPLSLSFARSLFRSVSNNIDYSDEKIESDTHIIIENSKR